VAFVSELWEPLTQLVINLVKVLGILAEWFLLWAPAVAWVAWWLWGVNWTKTWPVLRSGAWVPLILGMLMIALVWSQLAPSDCTCLRFATVPNFWWQCGAVGLFTALTLFCGWLQGVFRWTPAEITLEPSADEATGHGEDEHH
jgi:hypothetical protein